MKPTILTEREKGRSLGFHLTTYQITLRALRAKVFSYKIALDK